MNGNKIILIAAIILGVFLLIPIGFYIAYFYNHIISNDPSNWGVFGDFFGGILNPIVALLNILVFLYLTRVISQSDEKAKGRDIEHQRNLTLIHLKHDTYKQLVNEMDLVFNLLNSNTPDKLNKMIDATNNIEFKLNNSSHLFTFLTDSQDKQRLSVALDKALDLVRVGEDTDSRYSIISDYSKHRLALIRELQKDILK